MRIAHFALVLFGAIVTAQLPNSALHAQPPGASSTPIIVRDSNRIPLPNEDAEVMETMLMLRRLLTTFDQMEREINIEIQGTSRITHTKTSPATFQSLQRYALEAAYNLERLCADPVITKTARLGVLVGTRRVDPAVPASAYPLILDVERGSPAEKAGIASGDVIVEVDGTNMRGIALEQFIKVPGKTVSLKIDRAGTARQVSAVLAKPSAPPSCDLARTSQDVFFLLRVDSAVAPRFNINPVDAKITLRLKGSLASDSSDGARGFQLMAGRTGPASFHRIEFVRYLGAVFSPLPQASSNQTPASKSGLRVVVVGQNTQADRGGLRIDDLVTRVGDKKVVGIEDLKVGLEAMKKKLNVELEVLRNQKPVVLTIPWDP